jgi:hypothetical protein
MVLFQGVSKRLNKSHEVICIYNICHSPFHDRFNGPETPKLAGP